VTAAAGDQPASISERANAPEVPNAAAVSSASSRPIRDRRGMVGVWV